jgi:hypothetical protein
MAGYSGTPLLKKLGIKEGMHAFVKGEPAAYWNWLSPLPEDINVVGRPKMESLDFAHLFVKDYKVFASEFLKMKKLIKKDGMLWISWPKKSSGVVTDIDETKIRKYGLSKGLVDVKVCAVDETWSGLKFMYRVKDR